jgi:3-dehydroquinate synthase
LGLLRADDVGRITALLERARQPVTIPDLGVDRYLELMGHDKKVEGGKLRFILMREMGRAFLTADVPRTVVEGALMDCVHRA